MKPKIISVICLALLLAAFAFSYGAHAQTVAVPATRVQPVTVISNPLALPEEVRAMMEKMSATNLLLGAGGTNAGKAAEPKDLATAVKTMKFERTPEALFEVVKSQQEGGKLSEVDKFRL